ncbi:MAG: hypothetical protein QGF59_16015, partial [Pirellulaceae bacterium]|nr:hypothetical protein [Pirellulaceae bacterium]
LRAFMAQSLAPSNTGARRRDQARTRATLTMVPRQLMTRAKTVNPRRFAIRRGAMLQCAPQLRA